MFSQEINGYNKNEVDIFVQKLKGSYESKIMEEKLKVLEAEKKVLDLRNQQTDIENKEKNILNALSVIEKAKQLQEDGSRNFYKLIMEKLELLIRELNLKFPQLKRDPNFYELLLEFSGMVKNYKDNIDKTTDITRPIYSDNDSMRLLLTKMQDYKKVQDNPKEVHIATTRSLKDVPVSESGFSFEEALNPTEDLSEIMKAFDFYNE